MEEIKSVFDLVHMTFKTADVEQPDCFSILCAIEQLSMMRPDMTVEELVVYIKKDNPRAFYVPERKKVLDKYQIKFLKDVRKQENNSSKNLI